MIQNISSWQLIILLLITMMVFGTRRLRGLGSDLGQAIRDFRRNMSDAQNNATDGRGAVGEDSSSPTSSDST